MLRNFSTSNKEKELQKSFATSSHRDQEGLAVAFRSTVRQKLIYLSSRLPSSSPPSVQTDRKKKRVKSTNVDRDSAFHLKVPDTFNFLPTEQKYLTQVHLALSSNSFSLIHFSSSFNISSLCGGSWHPCVRSRPLSPPLSALSVAVSCSHQRVQTHGVKPSSQRNVF